MLLLLNGLQAGGAQYQINLKEKDTSLSEVSKEELVGNIN